MMPTARPMAKYNRHTELWAYRPCFFIDPHGVIIAKGHPMSLLKKVEEVITAPK